MANTDTPDTSHMQPPPPVGAQIQLGPFARLQRWLEQSDTLAKRHFSLIGCPNYPYSGDCSHCLVLTGGGAVVYFTLLFVVAIFCDDRPQDEATREAIANFVKHPWQSIGAPLVGFIEGGVRAGVDFALQVLLMPLAPLVWCTGSVILFFLFYMYFLVPFLLVCTLFSWRCLAIKIPHLPPPFQRTMDAVALPYAVWRLAQLAMPNLIRPIATGVDLWLKYLAVTALFDVHVLPRLLNAAVELERCLQKTQES